MAVDGGLILYKYLSTHTAITGNSISVYGPPGLPVNYTLGKTILFIQAGGVFHEKLPISIDRWQIRCYGTTASQAHDVYTKLQMALNRKGHSNVTISSSTYVLQYAICTSGAIDFVEPSSEWPSVSSIWLIHILENPLT